MSKQKLNNLAAAFEKGMKSSPKKAKAAKEPAATCEGCGQPMPAEKLADLKASDS